VVVLVIKLRRAQKLAHLRVIIVVKKVMSLETAPSPQNPSRVTSVVRKATSLVIARKMPTVEEEEAEKKMSNATNVVKPDISLVHANLVVEVEVVVEGTMHLIVAVAVRLVILAGV